MRNCTPRAATGAAFGNNLDTGQPIKTCDWIDRIAPNAWAIMAVGTCATYGGIHAMEEIRPARWVAGLSGLGMEIQGGDADRLRAGMPDPAGQPFRRLILYLLYQAAGQAPMIPLDEALRPTWLFGETVHEGSTGRLLRAGTFATEYGSKYCMVKIGCWAPVVKCNVPKRGWINGVGGCPNVGGICIGCTMPGFPDKFMPFMNQPPGGKLSTAAVMAYGSTRSGHCGSITNAHAGPGTTLAPTRAAS